MRIRLAVPGEEHELAELLRASYAQYADVMPESLYASYLEDLADVAGRARDADVLVADAGAELLGTVTYYPDAARQGHGWPEGFAGVRALAVSPKARGLGLGGILLWACLERARAQRTSAVGLHTAPFMSDAIRLYERSGFRRASEYDFEAGDPSAPADARLRVVAYTRRLAA